MTAGAEGRPAGGDPVRLDMLDGGAIWRSTLATPKANILDRHKVGALSAIFDRAPGARNLKAIVLEGEGPNFSFGASVEEHLPGQFEAMLRGFHGLLRRMLDSSVVTLAAVRGQCLGGGLELASLCNRVFASPDARLGQPEIALGVFAPAASVFLAERIGRGAAEDLCLSGRSLSAAEARSIGLVDAVDDDPGAAALRYAREHLLKHSASSLRHAERLYAERLMVTEDAVEGLRAFLEKRAPRWKDA